ncbi:MAG TPA: hypothetical protein VGC04_14045 [Cellulomonas sp.]
MTHHRTRSARLAAGSLALLAVLVLAGCTKNGSTPASSATDGTMSQSPAAMTSTTPDAMMTTTPGAMMATTTATMTSATPDAMATGN